MQVHFLELTWQRKKGNQQSVKLPIMTPNVMTAFAFSELLANPRLRGTASEDDEGLRDPPRTSRASA